MVAIDGVGDVCAADGVKGVVLCGGGASSRRRCRGWVQMVPREIVYRRDESAYPVHKTPGRVWECWSSAMREWMRVVVERLAADMLGSRPSVAYSPSPSVAAGAACRARTGRRRCVWVWVWVWVWVRSGCVYGEGVSFRP